MRNLVFSKFFSRAIKTIGRKPECYLNAEGLTLWSKISDAAVRFVWRGFRDSKGRRVAYVAFDRSGGVIAYRDYYTLDEKVERDIAAYCKRFGLRLAA